MDQAAKYHRGRISGSIAKLMTTHQQLAAKIKALTVFIIENKGRCFDGIEASRLFKLVAFYLLNGNLFCTYDKNGKVQTVVFVRREDSSELLHRVKQSLPLFDWQMPRTDGDAILIEGVIGKRKQMLQILQQVTEHWPDSPRRKLFTIRMKNNTPTLVELGLQTLKRFCQNELA
jgi:hypothetical protein